MTESATEHDLNDTRDSNRLSTIEKVTLVDWITENIEPRKTPNDMHTSYGLKHIFSKHNFYVTNGQFKWGMMICGFRPSNRDDVNWMYRISNKSNAFARNCRND